MCFAGCSSKEQDKQEELKVSFTNTYDCIYSGFDDSVKRAYNDVCNAIINYESEKRINVGMLERVQQLLYTSFPLVYLVNGISAKPDESGVLLSYKFEKDEHIQRVKDFDEKIKQMKENCGFSQSNNGTYLLNVYHYVSSNIHLTDENGITVYETIMNDKGNVFTYANVFEYLLLQKGINAFHILAEDAVGAGWGLSSAELNGYMYFFDVGSEYYSSKGESLKYFAMSYKELKTTGLRAAKYSSGGDAFKCNNEDFSVCRSCKSWSLENSTLKIHKYDLKDSVIELK